VLHRCYTEPGLLTGLLQIWSLQLVSHMLQCIVRHADVMTYRGRRAIEEATRRLTRAMDRADADLGRTHRSRRGSGGMSPGNEGYPTNGHKDDEGVHKLGRTAEQDYDRYVCQPMYVSLPVCRNRPLTVAAMRQSQAAWVRVTPYRQVLMLIKSAHTHPSHLAVLQMLEASKAVFTVCPDIFECFDFH